MADENVRKLDTSSFNETISQYAAEIKKFETIVKNVNAAADRAIDNWKGKGRDAFEVDCRQVQTNLKDISDIMYEMRDALIEAHAEYMKTDEALSKSYES